MSEIEHLRTSMQWQIDALTAETVRLAVLAYEIRGKQAAAEARVERLTKALKMIASASGGTVSNIARDFLASEGSSDE